MSWFFLEREVDTHSGPYLLILHNKWNMQSGGVGEAIQDIKKIKEICSYVLLEEKLNAHTCTWKI